MFKRSHTRKKIVELIANEPNDITDEIDSRERELINNILGVRDINVSNIMTPRGEIISIDIEQKTGDILDFIARNPHSRYPLYQDTLDQIIGTIHVKSVYAWLRKNNGKIDDEQLNFAQLIKKIIHKPAFVAPSMRVLDLLLYMREERNHIAFVVDEYGGIDGLVTIEDALEEIVGSIEDEYDLHVDDGMVANDDGSYIFDGKFKLEDFQNKFNILQEDELEQDFDTIGGLVVWLAGRVPTKGELIPWCKNISDRKTDAETAEQPLDEKNAAILAGAPKKSLEFEIIRSLPNRVVTIKLYGLPNLLTEK